MARCVRCGKKGFFLKVDASGLCNDCQSLANREAEAERLTKQLNQLNQQMTSVSDELQRMTSQRDEVYNEIFEKATKDALRAVEQPIIEKKEMLHSLTTEVDKNQKIVQELTEQINKSNKQLETNCNKLQRVKNHYKSIIYGIDKYFQNDVSLNNIKKSDLAFEADRLLSPTVELKLHCMDLKQLRYQYNQTQKTIKEVLQKYQGRYTTKANAAIYQLMVIALQSELQNILFNINFGKQEKAINSVKEMIGKYLQIAADGNQSIAPTLMKFIAEIEGLFITCVNVEYEYFIQKEKIKEEQRALREQMRQEAEERKALEQQQKQVEKEEQKYKNEIQAVQESISNTSDLEKIRQLEERLSKLQSLLDSVEEKKEEILNLQNGKAGYVYIISNIGSFGDDVFKVGMTRRLEPQERVNELGDASVPFPFDVHSFIFSQDAVNLENSIHKQLFNNRMNKINNRKEFFKVSIDELENLVQELEPSAEFNRTALAEQYYQSMSVENDEAI